MAEQGGLLDFLNSPGGMGLLSAVGAGLAGARRGGTWNAVGSGLLGGVQGYAQGQDLQRQNEYATQRGKLFDMQAQQLEQQQAAARAAAEKQAARENYLGGLGQVTSPRLDAQPNKFDPMQFVRLGGSIEEAQKLAGMGDWGRAEVARTLESQDAQGNKITLQFDKFGRPVGDGVQGYTAPERVDLGGSVQFVRPQAGVSLKKTMTPGERDASARGWSGLSLQRDQFAYSKSKDAQERADKMTGTGVVATEGERKAATLLQRLRGSKAQLDAVTQGDPASRSPGAAAEFVRSFPLIGGDVPANLITPESRQRVEAAQLDMLDAALTLGTGAAYTQEQLRGYAKSYFPQVGDSPQTIADKEVRLNNIIKSAEIAAGRAAPAAQPSPNQGGWSIRPK